MSVLLQRQRSLLLSSILPTPLPTPTLKYYYVRRCYHHHHHRQLCASQATTQALVGGDAATARRQRHSLSSSVKIAVLEKRQYTVSNTSSYCELRLGLGSTKWSQLTGGTVGSTVDSTNANSSDASSTTEPWSNMYDQIVSTALEHGVTTIEAGLEGGDQALADALRRIWTASKTQTVPSVTLPITILLRVGYRQVVSTSRSPPPPQTTTTTDESITATATVAAAAAAATGAAQSRSTPPQKQLWFPDDIVLPQPPPNSSSTSSSSSNNIAIHYNISPDYLRHYLSHSPLVQLKRDLTQHPSNNENNNIMKLIVMLHNPEELSIQSQAENAHSSQKSLSTALLNAFDTLQAMCDNNEPSTVDSTETTETTVSDDNNTIASNMIDGFGVVSNGLSLPATHPCHLSLTTILDAAKKVATAQQRTNDAETRLAFHVIQLPCNALETQGLNVARRIQHVKRQEEHLSNLSVYGMRPLTCYPDGGSGSGNSATTTLSSSSTSHPFVLADFALSSAPAESSVQSQKSTSSATTTSTKSVWTNMMSSRPYDYDVALQQALSHFDAYDILDGKAIGDLTYEEKETLDGCRILQDLLADVHRRMELARSWSQHQDYLYRHVIPIVHDTFAELDDDSAHVLSTYFAAHEQAARYHVATNTRQLLLYGEGGGDDSNDRGHLHSPGASVAAAAAAVAPTYSPAVLPQSKRLQEFGLEFVISQTVENGELQSKLDDSSGGSASHNSKTASTGETPLLYAFDKIILGCSHPEQVVDAVQIVKEASSRLPASSKSNINSNLI